MLCALALSAAPLLGPAAAAQTEPVFPEGVWRATHIFLDRQDVGAQGLIEYTGFGSARLEGVSTGETINVSGEIQFEAASKAESALSTSERVYQGVWRVEGWGATLDAFGDLSLRARETPKGGATASFQKDYELESHGSLTLTEAQCTNLYVTFETEVIPLPGAITGPALIGWLVAFPDSISGEYDAMYEELTELAWVLTTWMATPDLSSPGAVPAVLERMQELADLVIRLHQASADSGKCGLPGEFYRDGPAYQFIAELLGDLASIVGFANTQNPNQVSAETMIEVYGLASRLGAFHSPDGDDVKTMNVYPIELEKLLADAIVDGQPETIDAIWAAAVQYGWQSLAEKAESAR